MAIKTALARVAYTAERGIDTFRRGPSADDPVIDCYGGYTTTNGIVLRGRVLAQGRDISGQGPQSKWRNFKDFLSLFYTDELVGIEIFAPAYHARTITDEEGFFVLRIMPEDDDIPSQITIKAAGVDEGHHVPIFDARKAAFGVISDIDDTILRTGAYSLIKNLWTSATGNVHQREVFSDAVKLLRGFAGQKAAFFYVSSSPWNLYNYLQSVFVRSDLPLGPFFLRDLGIAADQFITGTHSEHKTDAIEAILVANPHLNFTLVGDTGQHDPHVYAAIVRQHAPRINRVILRRPNDAALSAAVENDLAEMTAAGVPVTLDFDYLSLVGTDAG